MSSVNCIYVLLFSEHYQALNTGLIAMSFQAYFIAYVVKQNLYSTFILLVYNNLTGPIKILFANGYKHIPLAVFSELCPKDFIQ